MHVRSHEAGQVTLFLAGCCLGLVLLAGLSVDGGRILSAREQAWDEAQEAARAGADALSVADLRGQGETVVDIAAAQEAVATYMTATGDTAVVTFWRRGHGHGHGHLGGSDCTC